MQNYWGKLAIKAQGSDRLVSGTKKNFEILNAAPGFLIKQNFVGDVCAVRFCMKTSLSDSKNIFSYGQNMS